MRQRMGGGNTPSGVSPHPQGARLALQLVRQGDGLHYPVGQPLFGDSLPFLLPFVADKELLRASDAPVCGPCICAMLLRDTATLRLDLPPPRAVLAGSPPDHGRRGGNLRHVSRPGSQDNVRVDRPEHKALFAYRKLLEVPNPFDGSERGQERCLKRQELQLDKSSGSKGPL